MLAVEILNDVDKKRAYAGQALDRHLSAAQLDARERSLVTEIVYGTLRNRGYIDWAVGSLAPRGVGSIDYRILNILRTAIYQVRFLTRIPPFAAVNEAVDISKRVVGRNAPGFVNGLLRAFVRRMNELVPPSPEDDPVTGLSIAYSFPEWMISRWLTEYGFTQTVKLCEYLNATPPLTVRVNALRAQVDSVVARLTARGIDVSRASHTDVGLTLRAASAVSEIPEFLDGLITVQGASSMLVAPVVHPQPGQFVIDACSAPGGKTTHLAELMQDRGRILSLDLHEHRLKDVDKAVARLGLSCVETVVHDATKPLEQLRDQAHAVLIDAPCSGLGVLNRRPDARWRRTPADIEQLVALQKSILSAMAPCVRPGGVLVYSTCTIVPEENDGVVEWFMKQRRDFAPSPIAPYLPESLVKLGGTRGEDDHSVRILPFIHNIDGFYIARLTRTS
jgi:16S rRNA (cytosine967-C5)-methyltransferase